MPPSPLFSFQGDSDLIFLRNELYDGDWGKMLEDLQERLKGRPLNYRLQATLTADIASIQRLMGNPPDQPPDLPSATARKEIVLALQVPSPPSIMTPGTPRTKKPRAIRTQPHLMNMTIQPAIITVRDKVHQGSWFTYLQSIVDTETQGGLSNVLQGLLIDLKKVSKMAEEFQQGEGQKTLDAILTNQNEQKFSIEMLGLMNVLHEKQKLRDELQKLMNTLSSIWKELSEVTLQDETHKIRIDDATRVFKKQFEDTFDIILKICSQQDDMRLSETA